METCYLCKNQVNLSNNFIKLDTMPVEYAHEICYDKLNERGKKYLCLSCGKTPRGSNHEACKECGSQYVMSDSERKFFNF